MADINEILGKSINSVKSLKDAIKDLQNSLIGVDANSQEFKETSVKLAAAQDELLKVTRAGKDENIAAKDSIAGMEKEYRNLYSTYKQLTDEQRNSSFGKEMADQLSQLSEKINTTKKDVGNFTNNIGQYAQGASEAFNKMGISVGGLQKPLSLAANGTKGLGTALKGLAANPIVLVITALVAILAKAAAAIKDNEQLTNRLKEAMSVFKPVLDAVSNAFDFLAGLLVKAVEGLSKVAEKIMSIIPGMKSAIDSHKELAKATNDLTKATREANVENSKKQAEVERLREEASATEDVIEKKKLLEEAKTIQGEIDQKNIELAQEELRIMEEYADKTANSAEENEKLAAAQQKVNAAIAQGERNQRLYNKQLSSTRSSTRSASSAVEDYRKKAKELYEQLIENNKDEITKITEKYEKEKKLLEKYHYDTKLLTKRYNEEIAEEQKKRQKEAYDRYKELQEASNNNYALLKKEGDRQQQLLESLNPRAFLQRALIGGDGKQSLMSDIDDLKEYVEYVINDLKGRIEYFGKEGGLGTIIEELADTGFLTNLTDYDNAVKQTTNLLENWKNRVKDLKVQYVQLYDQNNPENESAMSAIKTEIGEITNNITNLSSALELLKKEKPEDWIIKTKGLEEMVQALNAEGFQIESTISLNAASVEVNLKKQELKEKIRQAKLAIIQEMNLDEELDMMIGGFDPNEIAIEQARNSFSILQEEKRLLQEDLAEWTGTYEKKMELTQRLYDIQVELMERQAELEQLNQERTAQMVQSLLDSTDAIGSSLDSLSSTYTTITDSQLKAGKIDEQEATKRKKRYLEMEKVATAFNIATILGDLAAGSFSIWKGYAEEVGKVNPQTAAAEGPGAAVSLGVLNAKSLVSAIARQTALAATATAQMAAARGKYVSASNNFQAEQGGSSSVSLATTPTLIDSSPYTYTRTIQTTEEEDELNRPIYVRVTDIMDGIDTHNVQVSESSF